MNENHVYVTVVEVSFERDGYSFTEADDGRQSIGLFINRAIATNLLVTVSGGTLA